MGGIWHQAGCCCVKPCLGCASPLLGEENPQLDAEATITGSDNEDVLLFEGTWIWQNFFPDEGVSTCYWRFVKKDYGSASGMHIHHCPSSAKWYADAGMSTLIGNIHFGGSATLDCPDAGSAIFKEITGLVNCNKATGKLAGAFTLDCTDVRFPEAKLHVTLGG